MKTEISLKTRREFLRTTALSGALSWTVPAFLANTFDALQTATAASATQVPTGKDSPILVVLQMAGGNDGLNTVVPFANDHYYRARPRLAVTGKDVLKLNDALGLHPTLAGLKELFDAGRLAIVQGVGYPNPNRSHFRSTEIWQTASEADRFEKYGWLGRYFDNACAGCDATAGISIGRELPQAFVGPKPIGISLEDPERYRFVGADQPEADETASSEEFYRKMTEADGGLAFGGAANTSAGASIGAVGAARPQGSPLDFIERVALDAQLSSDQIRAVARKARNQAGYPASQLAHGLRLVARLIGGGLPTRVYYVSQGGYDTHTNQRGAHERLLKELGDAVKAFIDDLAAQGNLDRVLVMTFSEFGRRVSENASGGTDHGAAAPLFVVGSRVKPGLLGQHPSLAPGDLLNGDPKFAIDFRSVYASVLEQWLRTPSAPILGRKFSSLQFV
jgi:uncharacterized protein (DUF1501 family)